ncbi:hypothetical protein RBG61_07540 [Paludicola sp. MB14-C6]|uniref:hypothetical protein n=1 Tax=Paludihabitans sp. MB14-C6 TaxID=3070656 RepID=UPI0027DE9578|nr:hypothetical protein [Paludicola sp. MB14-C6]WMJ21857.1 hypothetical protein RBG61_07540 [Paludicola sp. MB14-C6]
MPVARYYLLGNIADHINKCKGKKTSYRKKLVGLYCAVIGMIILSCIVFLLHVLGIYLGLEITTFIRSRGIFPVLLLLLYFALIILYLVACVFKFIASYQIYCDYDPNNAVLYLILSIIFRAIILQSIFLFVIRNKPSLSIYYAQQYQHYMQNQQAYCNPQQPYNSHNPNIH